MNYMIKLGEDTSYEEYQRMIDNHELDDVITEAMAVVDKFKAEFPSTYIDEVQLVVNKTGEITTDIKEIIIEERNEQL